jgi:peptidyl-prolyl cis-trans isomerase SurA
MYSKTAKIRKYPVQLVTLTIFFLGMFIPCYGQGEVVDRIVAIVNDEVITLTDVQIIQKFGLFEELEPSSDTDSQTQILHRLINQKLVIQLASERVIVEEEELEASLSDVVQKTDPELAGTTLLQFGLDWDDLRSYLRDRLLFQKIISQRFSRGVIVSIEEIERYYEQVYVPSQREKSLDPLPMIQVLDRIERELQRDKVEDQVQEWIENLKREANIQIKVPRILG